MRRPGASLGRRKSVTTEPVPEDSTLPTCCPTVAADGLGERLRGLRGKDPLSAVSCGARVGQTL